MKYIVISAILLITILTHKSAYAELIIEAGVSIPNKSQTDTLSPNKLTNGNYYSLRYEERIPESKNGADVFISYKERSHKADNVSFRLETYTIGFNLIKYFDINKDTHIFLSAGPSINSNIFIISNHNDDKYNLTGDQLHTGYGLQAGTGIMYKSDGFSIGLKYEYSLNYSEIKVRTEYYDVFFRRVRTTDEMKNIYLSDHSISLRFGF